MRSPTTRGSTAVARPLRRPRCTRRTTRPSAEPRPADLVQLAFDPHLVDLGEMGVRDRSKCPFSPRSTWMGGAGARRTRTPTRTPSAAGFGLVLVRLGLFRRSEPICRLPYGQVALGRGSESTADRRQRAHNPGDPEVISTRLTSPPGTDR